MAKATDEVANDKGESGSVLEYNGSKCSNWPSEASGCRGKSTKSRKNAQMACCSGKSLNIRGTVSSREADLLMALFGRMGAGVAEADHGVISPDEADFGGDGNLVVICCVCCWRCCSFFFWAFRRTAFV